MPLEAVGNGFINDLDIANPPGTDSKSQGDDHLRMIKAALKKTFPLAVGVRKLRDDTNTNADTLLLTLYKNRPPAFPAANDALASLIFSGNNLAGTERNYARIRGSISSPANGVEAGRLDFFTMLNGVETATLSATPTTFSAAGLTIDTNNAILSADGTGGSNNIFLRPNGLADTSGELQIDQNGLVYLNGVNAGNGQIIIQYARASANGSINQVVAQVQQRGFSNTGVERVYGQIYTQILDPTNTTEDSQMVFNIIRNGIPASAFIANTAGTTFSGVISGNGSGLTTLNAANISSGTIADARLPDTIDITRLISTDIIVPLHYFNAADLDTYIQYLADGVWRSVCNGVEAMRASSGGISSPNFTTAGTMNAGQFTTTNGSYATTAGNFTTVNGSFITTNGGIDARNGELKIADILVNKVSPNIGVIGLELGTNGCWVTKAGNDALLLNRIGPFGGTSNPVNGAYIAFMQSGTAIGNMQNINGAITLNAFMGSHWSQTVNNLRVSPIYQGTVVESLDAVCFWAGEPAEDRLPRFKVSDVVDSPAVYGVWLDWDESDTLNDALIATAGLAWVRMKSGQVVVRGDLVSSNGDGCAKKQTGTAITNATLGKIVSNTVHETYPDGSFRLSVALRGG